MKLDVKAWINNVTDFIKTKRYAIVYHGSTNVEMVLANQTVTSNSSGLISITDLGVNASNSYGMQAVCTTSNYRFSNPILWSNGNYYVTLYAWNGSSPIANTQVRMILTWFRAV